LKCDVAFPIEGFTLDVPRSFSVGDIKFELNNPQLFPDPEQRLEQHNIQDIRIMGLVTGVDGKDSGEVKNLAYQLVEKAVNNIQFLIPGSSLRTVDEVYFRKRYDGPEIDDNFRILSIVTTSVRVGRFDSQQYIDEGLKPFGAIRDDRNETLEKALSYYRIAICTYNPFQAIESFFGAIQAIVIEMEQTDKPSEVIKNYIKPRILRGKKGMTENEFYTKFGSFWGAYRSGGTHGKYHVNDYSQMPDVSEAKSEVEQWTRIIINDYIKDSTQPLVGN
jgi:hypothetical protein